MTSRRLGTATGPLLRPASTVGVGHLPGLPVDPPQVAAQLQGSPLPLQHGDAVDLGDGGPPGGPPRKESALVEVPEVGPGPDLAWGRPPRQPPGEDLWSVGDVTAALVDSLRDLLVQYPYMYPATLALAPLAQRQHLERRLQERLAWRQDLKTQWVELRIAGELYHEALRVSLDTVHRVIQRLESLVHDVLWSTLLNPTLMHGLGAPLNPRGPQLVDTVDRLCRQALLIYGRARHGGRSGLR